MKNLINASIVVFLCLWTIQLSAQSGYKTQDKSMSDGVNTAIVVMIDESNEKVVKKEWERFMKDYGAKTKNVKKSDEHITLEAAIPGLTGDVQLFSLAKGAGNKTELNLWVFKNGTYLTEAHTDDIKSIDQLLYNFSLHIRRYQINEELDEQEKVLKGLENDHKKAMNDEEKANKTIDKCEQKISEAQSELKALQQSEASDTLGIMVDMKKANKDKKKANKTIKNCTKNINQSKINITKAQELQATKSTQIEQQQKVIEEVKQRLENVGKEDAAETSHKKEKKEKKSDDE